MTSPFSYVANMQRIRTKGLSTYMQSSSVLPLPNTEYALRKEELEELASSFEVFTVYKVGTSVQPVKQSTTDNFQDEGGCLSLFSSLVKYPDSDCHLGFMVNLKRRESL